MDYSFLPHGLTKRLIWQLSLDEAMAFFPTSRKAAEVFAESSEIAAAVMFARTRFQVDWATLGEWIHAWQCCAQGVEAEGWDVGVWAHAWLLTIVDAKIASPDDGWYDVNEVPHFLLYAIQKSVAQMPLSPAVRAILAINGQMKYLAEGNYILDEVSCVLLLSDWTFAFLHLTIPCFTDLELTSFTCIIGVTLREAVDSAVSRHGKLPWAVQGGRLEIKHVNPTYPFPQQLLQDSCLGFGFLRHDPLVAPVFRVARDDWSYTYSEFAEWYVDRELIWERWSEARQSDLAANHVSSALVKMRERTQASVCYQHQHALSSLDNTVAAISSPRFGNCDDCTSPFHAIIADGIQHVEPPAQIDEEEAAQISAVQHAGFVERFLHTATEVAESDSAESDEFKVIVSALNRNTKLVRTELCEGSALRNCRKLLESCGHAWKLPSGALVFVSPQHYRPTMRRIDVERLELKPSNIVFEESHRYLVEEALSTCNAVCKGTPLVMLVSASWSGSASNDSEEDHTVSLNEFGSSASEKNSAGPMFAVLTKNTFICVALANDSMSVVTKSTTDIAWPNPRNKRLMPL